MLHPDRNVVAGGPQGGGGVFKGICPLRAVACAPPGSSFLLRSPAATPKKHAKGESHQLQEKNSSEFNQSVW